MCLYDIQGPFGYVWEVPECDNKRKPVVHDLLKRYVVYGKKSQFDVMRIRTARFGVVDVVRGVVTCCRDVAATMAQTGAIVAHEVYKSVVASTTIVIKSSHGRSNQSPNRRQMSDDTHTQCVCLV